MDDTARKILVGGRLGMRPPKDIEGFLRMRSSLVGALEGMGEKDRIKGMQNLCRYAVRYWKGEESLKMLLVMEKFGRTEAYREIYKKVIVTSAWSKFCLTFGKIFSALQ